MDLTSLNNDYLMVFPQLRAISIYESFRYDQFDMDLLGPSQRKYLITKAHSLGFIQESGKWLVAPDKTRIYFPGQKLFNRSFKAFLPNVQDESTWLATTPTQTAYLLLRSPSSLEEDLFQLMIRQPFNLERLSKAIEHEDFFPRFNGLLPELTRLYERAQVLLKNKLPLDKLQRF
jgi:hypothetical protein